MPPNSSFSGPSAAPAEFKRYVRSMIDSPPMESRFRAITAQSWSGMLAVLLTMFIVDLVRFSMLGQYAELSKSLAADPGSTGLWILVCFICLNVL